MPKLRVVRRHSRGNLFVRLPRECVERLRAQVDGPTAADFLPLSVQLGGETLYLSYNGGDIESHSDKSTVEDWKVIELPSSVLPTETLPSHAIVEVLPFVKDAPQVFMEPLTVDDWELLERFAEQLEGGALLQQVSVVYPGQVLALQVQKGVVASVKVLPNTFESSEQSIWPEEAALASLPCVRLVADTQVVISPKPHVTPEEPILRAVPCGEDYSKVMHDLALALGDPKLPLVGVEQCTVAVHPRTLESIPGILAGEENIGILRQADSEDNPRWAVARIVGSLLIAEDAIAMHPLIRLQLNCQLYLDHVAIHALNHIERDRMTKLVTDAIQSGQNELRLVPVTLARAPPGDKPWRTPDVSLTAFPRNSTSAVEDVIDQLLDITDGSLPVGIGSTIALPWKHATITDTNVFRLVLVAKDKPGCSTVVEPEPKMITVSKLPGMLHTAKHNEFTNASFPDNSILIETAPPISVAKDFLTANLESSGIVLCGHGGSGKTHAALTAASHLRLCKGYSTVYLDCKKLRDVPTTTMKDILLELSNVFDVAVRSGPCSVILDDADEFAPSFSSEGPSDDSSRSEQINPALVHQAKLLKDALCCLVKTSRAQGPIFVIATCEAETSLQERFVTALSVSARPLLLPSLDSVERENLFERLLHEYANGYSNLNVALDVGKATEGYRPRDIQQLALRVGHHLRLVDGELSIDTVVEDEITTFVPNSRRSAGVEPTSVPSWASIGGLCDAKEVLEATLLRPSIYQRIYESSPLRLPRGILLYGPSGCGKSYLVPPLAKECGYRLITCRGPELLDKYIGASEANVRELFARAAAVAPSILFLDEFDALAPRRGSDHTGVTDRIVNQLLTFLDGVEDLEQRMYIVAATSRPDKIDPALLRPGRLEKHVYVGTPQHVEEASDILSKIIAEKYAADEEALASVKSAAFLGELWESTPDAQRMSAADMKGACNAAHVLAVHEAIETGNVDHVQIGLKHFKGAFESMRPSLPRDEYQRLQAVYAPFMRRPSRNAVAEESAGMTREAGKHLERDALLTSLR